MNALVYPLSHVKLIYHRLTVSTQRAKTKEFLRGAKVIERVGKSFLLVKNARMLSLKMMLDRVDRKYVRVRVGMIQPPPLASICVETQMLVCLISLLFWNLLSYAIFFLSNLLLVNVKEWLCTDTTFPFINDKVENSLSYSRISCFVFFCLITFTKSLTIKMCSVASVRWSHSWNGR